jgi:predicted nucleotidyltransferase
MNHDPVRCRVSSWILKPILLILVIVVQTIRQTMQKKMHNISLHLQHRLPDLLALYAFGSRVSGNSGPLSDLDLAILAAGRTDPVALWTIAGELADIAGCPVDLIDLCAANTVMQYRIITTGERLWTRNHQSDLYESFILGAKSDLDEARAPLLERIRQEGTIHGR